MAKTPASHNPAGFDLYRSDDEFPARTVAFLIPSRLTEQIEAEREAQQKLAEAGTLAAAPELGKQNSAPGIAAKQPSSRLEPLDPEREEGELAVPVAGVDYDPAERHCVYDAGEPLNLLRNRKLATADRDRHAQIEELYRKLKARGCLRPIAMPARGLESMKELEQSQPHFKAVISTVRDRLVLAQRVRRPLTIPPILLLGEPGVGKTHFAKALARALGSSIRQFAFDSDVSNAAMLGSAACRRTRAQRSRHCSTMMNGASLQESRPCASGL